MRSFLFTILAALLIPVTAAQALNIRQNADGTTCWVNADGICKWTINSKGELTANGSPAQRVSFMDDFLAAAIEARVSSTAGAGAGTEALTVVANSDSGTATLTSSSADSTHAANCSSVTLDQTNFAADQGNLMLEVKGSIDDVSEAAVFIGFTDTISSTVELPIYLLAGDIDSDAANAAGVVYDVDATTDVWTHGGVKANTDTAPVQTSNTAPADATDFTIRVEIDSAGGVRGFVDGVAIGAATANAVTATTSLTPAIVVCNRSANQVIGTFDYIYAQQDR